MRSYAASTWAVLWKVRVPASLPYLFAALKVSATASVVGAIIGELPASIQDGLGGAILNFNQYYASAPTRLWATNIVAAALGIAFFLAVVAARAARRAGRRSTSHERTDAVVSAAEGHEAVRQGRRHRAPGGRPRDPAGRVRLADRALRLRQVDAAPRRRRPDPADVGDGRGERQERRRARLDRDYGIVFQDAVLSTGARSRRTSACRSSWPAGAASAAASASARCSSSSS